MSGKYSSLRPNPQSSEGSKTSRTRQRQGRDENQELYHLKHMKCTLKRLKFGKCPEYTTGVPVRIAGQYISNFEVLPWDKDEDVSHN